jgi:hypothetical protein
MPKNLNFTIIILVFALMPLSVFGQTLQTDNKQQETVEEQINENKIENIVSVEKITYQIRKKYGIQGSVILSQSLWQILQSYSNQQQAENMWQTALNKVANNAEQMLNPQMNLHFSRGQVLSDYTYGMTLEKWHENKAILVIKQENMNDFFSLNDDLTIYWHLQTVWELILQNIVKHEDINWPKVFLDSISIEASSQLSEDKDSTVEKSFLQAFQEWSKKEGLIFALADLMKHIDGSDNYDINYYHSMIRYNLNKYNQYLLATAIKWFEVDYYLRANKEQLTEKDIQIVDEFIEQNDAWFLSQEQVLLSINLTLPEMVESSMHNLKGFYRGEIQTINQDDQSTNAFTFIEPNIKKYWASPFRQKIRLNLEACLNISEKFAPFPQSPIDKNQFEGCINDMITAAVIESTTRELSGSLTKVDSNKQALDRALQLPAWQIINILYAHIAKNQCLDQSQQLPNPFEWSLAAESLLWFTDRWPNYTQAYLDEEILQEVIGQGEKLTQGFTCLEKPLADSLSDDFSEINQAWQGAKAQIKQVAEEFNQQNLRVDSDLNLFDSVEQNSNYRVVDAQITACDAQKSCGVHVQLESSRALFGLFPNHLLVADQLKLGQLKLCYDNVGWENRRSASTHLDNTSVANYFGNFSFSLKGFYDEKLVFEKNIISDQEDYYLFAQNNDEVLASYCPLSMIGSKILTRLERGTYGLVPNRLTFLTASRASEANILTANWSAGYEWRDKLVGEESVALLENKLQDYNTDIQKAYQQKATDLQELIYATLMNNAVNPTEKQQLLTEQFKNLQRLTALLQSTLSIIQPDALMGNDQLHGLFFGERKIPNLDTVVNYYKNQLNINQLIVSIDEILQSNQNKWNNFSPKWSNTYLNNILYRLKTVN